MLPRGWRITRTIRHTVGIRHTQSHCFIRSLVQCPIQRDATYRTLLNQGTHGSHYMQVTACNIVALVQEWWNTARSSVYKEFASTLCTMLYGISEEDKLHGDDARLHVVVLQLVLHVLLELSKVEYVLIHRLFRLQEVTWRSEAVGDENMGRVWSSDNKQAMCTSQTRLSTRGLPNTGATLLGQRL